MNRRGPKKGSRAQRATFFSVSFCELRKSKATGQVIQVSFVSSFLSLAASNTRSIKASEEPK